MEKADVIIIWWGPGGSALWTLLAKKNIKTILLEKWQFPKHSIGESLLPDTTNRFLKILGVKEKVDAAGFARKYGGTYVWGKTDEPWHLIFDGDLDNSILWKKSFTEEETQKILDSDSMYSYQVNRYIFDKILADRAKEVGVDFRENTKVSDIIYDETGKIIWVKDEKGNEYYADLVVDAGGRDGFIRNKLWISERNEDLWFFSLYTYFKDCDFLDSFYSKYTQLIVSIDIGWIWFIHIGWGLVSVWIVTNSKEFSKEEFMEQLYKNSYVGPCIQNAVQCDYLWNPSNQILALANWSNLSKKLYGENYVLIGDAGGFVDPILSGGMSFAINSAFVAYVHIIKYLENKDMNTFQSYEKIVFSDIANYVALAKFWYGNNRALDSYFWVAKRQLGLDISNNYNRLAFIYLSSGKHYSDRNLRLYNGEIQIWEKEYGLLSSLWKHERIRIDGLIWSSFNNELWNSSDKN